MKTTISVLLAAVLLGGCGGDPPRENNPRCENVAGCWDATIQVPEIGFSCSGQFNIAGQDAALTATWNCLAPNADLHGDATGRVIDGRLSLALEPATDSMTLKPGPAPYSVDAGCDASGMTGTLADGPERYPFTATRCP